MDLPGDLVIRESFISGNLLKFFEDLSKKKDYQLLNFTLGVLESYFNEIRSEHPEWMTELEGDDWQTTISKIKVELDLKIKGSLVKLEEGFNSFLDNLKESFIGGFNDAFCQCGQESCESCFRKSITES